ncbi:PREDICTED: regenerating islet-derived protein 4 isoform X2 [Crocodylus porosus]|uniref:regenerating islet-derived protein 4 isoform X2 n=1 Tax=Crocodylus porosus TaxID=8502 RepID=UPI00093BB1A2|nr:PREDICTED: regenerating islet-derived protein 4 isoform X2 [Crocodylus porosus]XP_019386286.1 PREDICTED: regenerating islet-derived protein 4 isoform X2 [Crocodylus porosus]
MLLLETVVLLLLLSCPGLGKRTELFSCLPGWYYSKTSCFRYFQSQRSWADAEAYCQSLKEGAHLPCLHEAKDLQYIAQTISYYQQTRPVWIGLNDSQKNQDWKWLDGSTYKSTSWLSASGSHNGSCAKLSQDYGFKKWSGADCREAHPFVCKYTVLH